MSVPANSKMSRLSTLLFLGKTNDTFRDTIGPETIDMDITKNVRMRMR